MLARRSLVETSTPYLSPSRIWRTCTRRCCLRSPPVSPPEQAAELLPWYMQWSWDLAAEMHRRRLVWNEARCTDPSPISYHLCDCTSDWRCEPHDACFI